MHTSTRTLAASLLALALQAGLPAAHAAQASAQAPAASTRHATFDGDYVTTRDGVRLYVKDWGPKDGPVVTFSHGWPLNSDSWESQMLFLAEQGYRVVAHDRRGHGRSSQPWDGNDMDHYADDLAAVITALDLQDVTLVGFSTGGGEVARYIGRHGTARVKKAALVSAVTPFILQTDDNPDGVPLAVFDGFRAAAQANRSRQYLYIASGPFFGFNRPGAEVDDSLVQTFWSQGMQAGHRNTFESIAAFSATDFRGDLAKFDVPTLVIHGDDDQVVPVDLSARAVPRFVPQARVVIYPGAPHGITHTHKDQLNQDLLAFLKE